MIRGGLSWKGWQRGTGYTLLHFWFRYCGNPNKTRRRFVPEVVCVQFLVMGRLVKPLWRVVEVAVHPSVEIADDDATGARRISFAKTCFTASTPARAPTAKRVARA